MTFERFSQLWDQYAGPVVGIDAEPHTIAALIACGKGDFFAFDAIDGTVDKGNLGTTG